MGRDDESLLQGLQREHDRLMSELRGSSSDTDKSGGNGNNNNNPFYVFKSFVDSNLNSLRNALAPLPENIAELRSVMERIAKAQQEKEQDISFRWTGSRDTPDHIQMELSRSTPEEREDARAATLQLLTEAHRKNAHVPVEKIQALYGRDESWLEPSPWLGVGWFKRSSYSPVRLENHPGLQEKNWRAAFEDLMNASLDKPMDSREYVGVREPYGKPQSTHYGPGLEWMLSLQCRGILPPLLPSFYSNTWSWLPEIKQSSVLDELSKLPSTLPWTHEIYYGKGDYRLVNDFRSLMSEVAIKSTSDISADLLEPKPLRPETEQDLYDSPYIMPHDTPKALELVNRKAELMAVLRARGARAFRTDEFGNRTEMHLSSLPLERLELEAEAQERDSPVLSSEDAEELLQGKREVLRRLEATRSVGAGKIIDFSLDQLEQEEKMHAAVNAEMEDHDEDEDEDEDEEWENLREMVGEKRPTPAVQSPAEQRLEASVQNPKKPDVLSALTTTRTTRSPDGTVTTEVVLKKRFSDGTETTEESVHTSNEGLERRHQLEQEEDKPKKKGWFWT